MNGAKNKSNYSLLKITHFLLKIDDFPIMGVHN